MKNLIPLICALFVLNSCSKNFYPHLSLEDLKNKDWYEFKSFKYKGDIKNNQPNGQGILVYKNGVSIEGGFINGVLHDDNAFIKIPNLGEIKGKVKNGALHWGKIKYYNGDYYQGGIQNYERNGDGLFVESNGDVKIGKFVNGQLNGKGKLYTSSTKNTHIGNFLNGKMTGEIAKVDGEGNITGEYFENGLNKTKSKTHEVATKQLAEIESKELAIFNEEKNEIAGKILGNEEKIVSFEAKMNTDYSDICHCVLNQCLNSGGGMTVYWHDYFDTPGGYSAIVPYGSDDEEIRKRLQAKKEFVDECRAWSKAPESYTGEIQSKINKLNQLNVEYLKKQEKIEKERQAKEKQIISERAERLKEIQNEELSKMKKKAEEIIARQRAFCASNPNNCGCSTQEELKACINDKERTCVCEE